MTLKAIISLREPKTNPTTGDIYMMIGGRIGGDEYNYLIQTAFGWLVLPKEEATDVLLVHEELTIEPEGLPYVWFVNDINAAE